MHCQLAIALDAGASTSAPWHQWVVELFQAEGGFQLIATLGQETVDQGLDLAKPAGHGVALDTKCNAAEETLRCVAKGPAKFPVMTRPRSALRLKALGRALEAK